MKLKTNDEVKIFNLYIGSREIIPHFFKCCHHCVANCSSFLIRRDHEHYFTVKCAECNYSRVFNKQSNKAILSDEISTIYIIDE